ncbi:MAG TPA: hypothetical protein VEU62_11770, partial [Bryobacterales bacterium]|nr:hypothetical protein [Bryobacterales bacterium]
MKLAFISPLPPARTGVADYAAGLLRALRESAQVDVVDTLRPGCDNAIYQLGNNPLHLAAYRAALAAPGIAVLHDAVLHHLLLGSLDEPAYIAEFVHNYGEWSRDLAADLWRSRSRSAADARYFQYPMLRRVVERSRAVVVHNPGAARMAQEAAAGARVVEIPHYFVAPPLAGDGLRTRDRLGIASSDVVVSVFGYLRDSKRIASVLQALPAARRARLLLVGEFVSSELERSLAPRLEAAGAIRTGHVPEADFWRLAEITDICVNLRSPGAGETSGIAIKMMGIGKPVLVTAGEETARFPELAVVRIDPGEAEVEMLAHYLHALAASEEMRR